jgi:hypothetical protein
MNFFRKSYNEIEGELNETKSKIQLLEEKIEYLIQKDIDMTKILCETNSKIQLLEEKIEYFIQNDIDMTKILCETNSKIQQLEEKLQKNTSSLISFTSNSLEIGPRLTSKTMFIDINCSKIIINADQKYGPVIIIDDVEIKMDGVDISKLISELKNIKNINYNCCCHIDSYAPIPCENKGYYLPIIKQILKINNNVKLMMSFANDFPYNWIKYILTDLHFDNILEIEITYKWHINRDNTDILTLLDNNKTIIFKNSHTKSV